MNSGENFSTNDITATGRYHHGSRMERTTGAGVRREYIVFWANGLSENGSGREGCE